MTLRETLEWYARQAAGCRKSHMGGNAFQLALTEDGGRRANEALQDLDRRASGLDGAKIETYDMMRDIAVNDLGYPSILEALEAAPHASTEDRLEQVEHDIRRAALGYEEGSYGRRAFEALADLVCGLAAPDSPPVDAQKGFDSEQMT